MAGIDTGIGLSAKQCIEIGRQAIKLKHYYQAVNWMQTAVDKIRLRNDTTTSLTEAEIELGRAKKEVSLASFPSVRFQ